MTTIAIEELELHLREVLARVRAGERIVVASDGEPVAEISPCDPLAALTRALPGVPRPTKHLRDVRFVPIPVGPGPDVVDVLREVRDDRDFVH